MAYTFQIQSSMAPKFEKLIQAIQGIRSAAEDTLNSEEVYLRSQREPDGECCGATDLEEDIHFPDVSTALHCITLLYLEVHTPLWCI